MIELKIPTSKGFSRSRGRPKQSLQAGEESPFLLKKSQRLRENLGLTNPQSSISWLDVCFGQGVISKDLFEVGKLYSRIRIRALYAQGITRFKSSSYLLIRHELKSASFHDERQKEWAETLWKKLARNLSPETIRSLDNLLLQEINYDLPESHYALCKARLKSALEEVRYYLS